MTKVERLRLNELSLKAFGSSSKWQKFVNEGEVADLVDETGRKYRGIQRYSLVSIENLMEEVIKNKELLAKKEEVKDGTTEPTTQS